MAFREKGIARAVRVSKPPLPGKPRDIGPQPAGITDASVEGTNTVYGGPQPLGSYDQPTGPAHLKAREADLRRRRWEKMGYF